jgi:hypothetical protein
VALSTEPCRHQRRGTHRARAAAWVVLLVAAVWVGMPSTVAQAVLHLLSLLGVTQWWRVLVPALSRMTVSLCQQPTGTPHHPFVVPMLPPHLPTQLQLAAGSTQWRVSSFAAAPPTLTEVGHEAVVATPGQTHKTRESLGRERDSPPKVVTGSPVVVGLVVAAGVSL